MLVSSAWNLVTLAVLETASSKSMSCLAQMWIRMHFSDTHYAVYGYRTHDKAVVWINGW